MTNSNALARMEQLEAAAFRHLVRHLRAREDVSNIDLMGLAGFCRNCLADWLADAATGTGHALTRDEARMHVYGEPYADFKARQAEATPEQLARMDESLARNAAVRATASAGLLDAPLGRTDPAVDQQGIAHPR